ncbi:DEAD/DEAH box helicase [Brevundimonas nasdae]|uniref:DEAD/DEAH box helicase n=1 Tax=Brevundimonas nasdae TaxID=172043 RepID=A0ABX8TN58_9CAUL|nr:DEAD/DEAH box helicase [Brevundimonas nasdae]QYC11503.1 DEAD/DEAH box helicase [Brevundimonas nasdae]QYC14291.1 DEAD/DEAH box helicase [Brevundimonas nasdae]
MGGTESEAWLAKTQGKASNAFCAAETTADRLAMLRELARLSGGRAYPPIPIADEDIAALGRFGLALAHDGAVRILDENLDDIALGLDRAMRVDPDPRGVAATAEPDAALLRLTTHRRYRSRTQKSAIQAILTSPDGASLMASMPTGAGKSLLFQLPTLWWREATPGACAVVVVPTVALAEDHQRTLQTMPGLEASRALSGSTSLTERQDVLARFRNGEIPILLLSPEAAFGFARQDLLQTALPLDAAEKYGLQGILAGVFIDEAHIVESWGRSFRPDFQRLPALISELRRQNPALRTVLLSATLNPSALNVLRNDYGSGDWSEIHARSPRYQFDLAAADFETHEARNDALLRLIDRAPRPAVVYTTRVDHAEALHTRLVRDGGYRRIALFTGAVADGDVRRRIVSQWADGDLDLVVATSAFGLGVDKSDVRTVIHACLPEGAARWYQEVGRASRDGHQGLGVTLWVPKGETSKPQGRRATEEDSFQSDEDDAGSMAGGGWLSRDIAEARWRALLAAANVDGRDPQTAATRLTLPLDAAREGMDPRYTGERNRGWNRSLLNLLQRQGVLTVDADAPQKDDIPVHWRVSVDRDDLLNLTDQIRWDQIWTEIFEGRDREVLEARAELRAFVKAMRRQATDCLLRSTYRLIEPEAAPEACGRCTACRAQSVSPPETPTPATAPRPWGGYAPRQGLMPRGVLLVAPEASDTHLIERLVGVGVEQVVAPERDAEDVARRLSSLGARFGFVRGAANWLRRDARLLNLPTALLPPSSERLGPWLREAERFIADYPDQSVILIADPNQRIDGRPLHQITSQHAPYDEAVLDAFIQDFREPAQ